MSSLYLRKLLLVTALLSYTICKGQAPVSFYQDSFKGGVTSAGWSPGPDATGTGMFSVFIPAGSTIRKAYLFVARMGPAPDITVELNTDTLVYNASTQVTPTFQQSLYGGPSGVCAVDVTSKLNPSTQNYTLSVTQSGSTSDIYTDFYLYIAFDNASLPVVNTAIFLDSRNMTDTIYYTPMYLTYPYVKSSDFGVSMYTGYLCDTTTDGENVSLDSVNLGLIGGSDINSDPCGGPIGSFYYYSDTLHGLSDDQSHLMMKGSDALSDADSVVPNNTDSIYMRFIHQAGGNGNDNNIWGVIFTYGGASVSASPLTSTICKGDSVILYATGATTYTWSPATGLSATTGDSVIAYPVTTTTYTVAGTYKGGVDSAQVIVNVSPTPDQPTITTNGDTLISSATQGNQWVRNDSTLQTATNQTYIVTIAGWYKLIVENPANGCSAASDSAYFTPTGVNQLPVNSGQVTVYPNPTSGEIVVAISPSAVDIKDWSLQITDVLGRMVYTRSSLSNNNDIDLSHLSGGVYFIAVFNKTGRAVMPVVK